MSPCRQVALWSLAAFVFIGMCPQAFGGDTLCAPSVAVCTEEEIAQIPVLDISNIHWSANVTSSGYSDLVIRGLGPFPRKDERNPDGPAPIHEMFSGEWAAAVSYDGMSPIWLEKCFRYPEWKSNSNFVPVEAPQFPDDPDGDGMNEGWSSIENDDLSIRVHYDMEIAEGGVALGKGTADPDEDFETSNPFVLLQTYEFTNISGRLLTDLSFYQLAHMHPANTETPTASIGYDDTMRMTGAFQDYRYDLTGFAENSGITDGYPTGSTFRDHVGLSLNVEPSAWGLGTYRGHVPGDNGLPETGGMKPVEGEHCDIENEALAGELTLLDDEVAGSFRYDLGDLQPDETKSVTVMLGLRSRDSGIPARTCLEIFEPRQDHLDLRLSKGDCVGGSAAGPYDIVAGSLYDLQVVPMCDPAFDCTRLIYLRCMASGHELDRFTLADDAHRLDATFYLARPSARFTSWGEGQPKAGQLPLRRFFFTPVTSPGVDCCDVTIP